MLQGFWSVLDHFGVSCIKGLMIEQQEQAVLNSYFIERLLHSNYNNFSHCVIAVAIYNYFALICDNYSRLHQSREPREYSTHFSSFQ